MLMRSFISICVCVLSLKSTCTYTHNTPPFGLATFQGSKSHGRQLSTIYTSQALTGVPQWTGAANR